METALLLSVIVSTIYVTSIISYVNYLYGDK